MHSTKRFVAGLGVAAGAGALIASIAIAMPWQQDQNRKGAQGANQQQEMPLPPGWTQEDMQAMMAAGTPGEMHAFLAKGAGEWEARTTMWMHPDAEPMNASGSTSVSPIMDGRFMFIEIHGEMPGMGPYHSSGVCGFDNVSQKFVSSFIDNHSTGIMQGTGELSTDGKTLTWTYEYNCPITKKPVTLREVETITGPDTKTLEAWGKEPKTGQEFKMMSIELKRKGAAGARPAGSGSSPKKQ